MKVRDSGMPPEEMWSEFFDVQVLLQHMQLTSALENVVDLGSGYGTFSIPAAQMVSGKVHAYDMDPEMIDFLRARSAELTIRNIETHLQDFIADGSGLEKDSMDYVMLFNILHHHTPLQILLESFRILKPGAKAGIIHWRSDIPTPRGPSLDIRPTPEQCMKWALESGFTIEQQLVLEPYHYGIVVGKPNE